MKRDILRDTLASVIAELFRLDPASLIGARASGVLDASDFAPKATRSDAGTRRGPRGPHKKTLMRAQALASSYIEGLSIEQVSAKHNVSGAAVRQALELTGTPARQHNNGGARTKAPNPANAERLARMICLRDKGATLEEIGASEKITRERVRQVFTRAGITTSERPLSPEDLAAVADYLAGASLDNAAETRGVSTHTMRRLLARAGHQPRPSRKQRRRQPQTLANAERVAQLYAEGFSTKEIAEKVGFKSPAQSYRLLAIAGIRPSRRPHLVAKGAPHAAPLPDAPVSA